jgi:hypothetical protein
MSNEALVGTSRKETIELASNPPALTSKRVDRGNPGDTAEPVLDDFRLALDLARQAARIDQVAPFIARVVVILEAYTNVCLNNYPINWLR